jgi:hypothetical protein
MAEIMAVQVAEVVLEALDSSNSRYRDPDNSDLRSQVYQLFISQTTSTRFLPLSSRPSSSKSSSTS